MTAYLSHSTAKKLHIFLGDNAPKPLSQSESFDKVGAKTYPKYMRYQLHDLLGKPFCYAMANKVCPIIIEDGFDIEDYWDIALKILCEYQSGGMQAVDTEVCKIMGGYK